MGNSLHNLLPVVMENLSLSYSILICSSLKLNRDTHHHGVSLLRVWIS